MEDKLVNAAVDETIADLCLRLRDERNNIIRGLSALFDVIKPTYERFYAHLK